MMERFAALGHAGGHIGLLWDYVRKNHDRWDNLSAYAFRAACAAFARTETLVHLDLEQLLTHKWDRDEFWLTELSDSQRESIPPGAISSPAVGGAVELFRTWRRGIVADTVLARWPSHPHWRVRDFGALILSVMDFGRIVTPCIDWLSQEHIDSVTRSLLRALECSKTAAGADYLLENCIWRKQPTEEFVARAAWRASDKGRATAVLSEIADKEDIHAAEALISLARLGHRHPRLKHVLGSSNYKFRMCADLATAYLADKTELDHILALQHEAANPTERVFVTASLAILGRDGWSEELHDELVRAAGESNIYERVDIFASERFLQQAAIDGLSSGGDSCVELQKAWLDELQPFDPIAKPVVPDESKSSVSLATGNPVGQSQFAPAEPTTVSERKESSATSEPSETGAGQRRGERRLQTPRRPRVLIVTALQKELTAVLATMNDIEELPTGRRGDPNIYRLAKLVTPSGQSRRVLVTTQSTMGKEAASVVGSNALRTFRGIEHILMVGIAGGCPSPSKPDEHVRLGDVVVSDQHGIIGYDYVKRTPENWGN